MKYPPMLKRIKDFRRRVKASVRGNIYLCDDGDDVGKYVRIVRMKS